MLRLHGCHEARLGRPALQELENGSRPFVGGAARGQHRRGRAGARLGEPQEALPVSGLLVIGRGGHHEA
ncbi:MAG: hypothetical protein ACREVV_01885 [Steroidobacteraceae bacterium]